MTTAYVSDSLTDDDSFVWQTGGAEVYDQLMGSYLSGPFWTVRFITFRGSVAERAEEYRVRLSFLRDTALPARVR